MSKRKRTAKVAGLSTPSSTPNQPRKRRSSINDVPQFDTHVLFIFVGQERKLITLHTDLLPDSTKTYLEQRGLQAGCYELYDESVEIVQLYRLFLYTGQLFSIGTSDQDTVDNGRAKAHSDAEWVRLAHCYLLGLTLSDERFANVAVDGIVEKLKDSDRYPTGLATEVYQNTAVGDNLRKLIIDLHVWKGCGTGIQTPHEDASGPAELLRDVLQAMAKAGAAIYGEVVEMPWETSGCAYHKHEATARCTY